MEEMGNLMVSSLNGDIGFLQTQVRKLYQQKLDIEKEISDSGKVFEEKSREYLVRIDSLQKTIDKMRGEASSLVVLIEEKNNEIHSLDAHIKSLGEQSSTHRKHIESLVSSRDGIQRDVDGLNKERDILRAISRKVIEERERMQAISLENDNANQEIIFLHGKIESLNNDIKDIEKAISDQKDKFVSEQLSYQQALTDIQDTINNKKIELGIVLSSLGQKKIELEEQERIFARIQDTVLFMRNTLDSLGEKKDFAERQLDYIQSQLSTIENHKKVIESQKQQIESSRYGIIKLEDKKAKIEKELENLSLEKESMRLERVKFQEEVNEFLGLEKDIKEREKNVVRQELMQISRNNKSNIKVLSEKVKQDEQQ